MRALARLFIIIVFWGITQEYARSQSPWHFIPNDVNSLHSNPANYRIPYGKDPLQFADLRLPDGRGPYPVLIIIHGGCWRSTLAGVQDTSALADALRDRGLATWNIEYRSVDNQGGGWPGTFEDLAHATDFLAKIGSQYSLDLNHLVVVGHSAGGHLALWLAARHKLPSTSQLYVQYPLRPKGVIVLGGVPDLKAFREQAENVCGADVIGKLLGNSPAQIAMHYREASPSELLPLDVPQILIYGVEDQVVPERFSRSYLQLARKKGDPIQLVMIPNAAHHEYIVPNSVVWPLLRSAISSLLN